MGWHASVAVDGFYGEPIVHYRRRIDSETPVAFVVIDEMELGEARGAAFHVQSRFPWREGEGGRVTTGEHASLAVAPEWQLAESTLDDEAVDGLGKTIYHLALRATPATAHRLCTRLTVRPVRSRD